MSTPVRTDRISHLRDLLGPAVLLAWPARSKSDFRKGEDVRLSELGDPNHFAKLERAGNIGVALGNVSNRLVTIDLDDDSYVIALLTANPLLNNTLRTRAARGCNFWLRCSGGYPPSLRLRNASGADIGEWRADGNQNILSGTHSDGIPYQFVVEKPVITISYD